MASDSEWELVDREEEGRPILGVFIPSVGFLPFGKQEGSSDLAVVPTSFTAVSSSAGLVLSRGPWSAYHVADLLSGAHRRLPRPSLPHPPDAPSVVIRVGPAPAGFFADVCAIGGGGNGDAAADGVYSFDAFDSLSGLWSRSSAAGDRFAVGRIDPDSGVAAAGSAYWRTCSPTPMVVGYDPSSGRVRILPPPPGAWASKDRWQLGSTRGGGLCSVVLTDANRAVGYELEASSDRWGLVGSVQLAGLASSEPIRFEWSGATMEVVLLLEGKLVVVDLEGEVVVGTKEVPTLTIAAKKMVPCVGKPKISDEEYVKVDDDDDA